MTEIRIKLTKRADDWHAAVADNSRLWGCGQTPSHAVGKLIGAHASHFGIEIVWPEESPPKREAT